MFAGLINFLEKKEYIQAVVAHEIAHNIMAHRYRTMRNHSTGLLLGALAGALLSNNNSRNQAVNIGASLGTAFAGTYSPEFEAEADYLGVYLMARSGMNISNVHNTWRRMSLLSTSAYNLGSTTTHPATPKRFVSLTKTIKEIRDKKKKGQVLLPNFKESNWQEILDKQVPYY